MGLPGRDVIKAVSDAHEGLIPYHHFSFSADVRHSPPCVAGLTRALGDATVTFMADGVCCVHEPFPPQIRGMQDAHSGFQAGAVLF